MLITEGRDVLRHDFHTHSLQSPCGIHSVLELLNIAAQKGTETINVSDHGNASGRTMNFGVLANPKRTPMKARISIGSQYKDIRLLAGVEGNIFDDGTSDLDFIKETCYNQFALISAGFHSSAKKIRQLRSESANFKALTKFISQHSIDILTHPCTEAFPLPINDLIRLAQEYQFALEVNNTYLVVKEMNNRALQQMIEEALANNVTLLCNSDGHTWYELFECGAVRNLIEKTMNLVMEDVFPLNFGNWESVLNRFKRLRVRSAHITCPQ